MQEDQRRVVIIGAGGHGQEVAEILEEQSRAKGGLDVLGFVDDNLELKGTIVAGLPVLGDWGWFDGVDRSRVAVICAVGNTKTLRHLAERAKSVGLSCTNAISPRATISKSARLGKGVIVFPNVFISTNVLIEDCCNFNVSATVSHDCHIGKYTNLNPAANLAGNVIIGEGSFIGMGAKVIQGIKIGDWAVLGAGSVVIRDVPPETTVIGVPAKPYEG